jgi:hypothetical protein
MASSLEGIEADFLLEEPTPEASKVVGRVESDGSGQFQCKASLFPNATIMTCFEPF